MRSHPAIVCILVVSLALAGCSGGDITQTDPTETTGSASTTDILGGASPPNGTLNVHFINVGQSVSTLLVGPTGETMLIDTGHYRDDGEYVIEYLQERGISQLDYLVVSHNDADHIGGNAAIIEHLETEGEGVGAVYDPGIAASTQTYERYLDAVEEYNVTLYETRAGDSVPFTGVNVSVLGPPDPYHEDGARNENSIVLKLGFGRTSFLFTGDAEETQEAALVERYGERLNVTVLKAGHHGSASSTGVALLRASSPRAVPISSGYDSQYGHPSEATLERLAERDIPVYWTATHGNIVFTSDGEQVAVKTQREAPTNPLDIRAGEPIEPGATGAVEQRAIIAGDSNWTAPTETTSTTTVADGGATPDALTIAEIHADATGDESENLNDEYVVFENTGETALDMGGWTIKDKAGATYTVPDGFVLNAGATVTLHTGSGTDTESDLYWGSGSAVWNNAGDTVIVTTDTGTEVLREEY